MSDGVERRRLLKGLGAGVVAGALGAAIGLPEASAQAPSAALFPSEHWARRFDAIEGATREEDLARSRSTNSWEHYGLAYGLDAYVSLFEASGDVRRAVAGLEYVGNVVGTARPSSSLPDSRYGDDFLGWASDRADTRGEEVPLFESYFWRYATRLLRAVRDNEDAAEQLSAEYGEYLAFAEQHVFDKWYSRGADTNIYRNRTHMASHWATIAMHLGALTDDEDRRARCEEVVTSIDRGLPNFSSSLHEILRLTDDGAYVWTSAWTGGPAQDVAHGNNMIAYVVDAADRGSGGWTAGDMRRFGRTLTTRVWREDAEPAERVDGSGRGTGWFSDGFVKLGRYDARLQQRLQGHDVRGAQFFAAMALNAERLRDENSAAG